VKVVHDDYTEKSAPERVRLYIPQEAEALLKERYAVINVWRAIRGPVLDTPLAVCDARTIAEDDLVPTEEGVKHEVYLFNFSPNHRWYYFSAFRRMTRHISRRRCRPGKPPRRRNLVQWVQARSSIRLDPDI